ncbi:MAG: proteinral secretion pathway protein N [Gallionellaceae bacterium]|nr:MAG: proteinral secretion pathway protein N [Gallionellaceae bacterium]
MIGAYKGATALFVFTFLLALLITAPASLLDHYLQNATGGRLVLSNAGGTIWSGSATPALRPQTGYALALQPLRWEVAMRPLLGGKIAVRLQWDVSPAAPPMSAVVSFDRAELHQARLLLPARIIEEASPALKPARLHGQLQIQGEKIALSKNGIEGGVTVDWLRAGSAFSSVDPLGDYRLTLSGAGDHVRIGLATISGKLLLEGQGSWSVARGLEFRGRAQASPENREALAELLRNLGPEEAPGIHGFNLTPQR